LLLNTSNNRQPDYFILLFALILLSIGITMVFSISSVVGYNTFNDSFYFIKRHLFSLIFGFFLAIGAYSVDLSFYKKIAPWTIIVSPVLLILTYIPFFSVTSGGSSRWVNIFGLSFQPSEVVKVLMIIYLANAIVNKKEEIKDFFFGLMPLLSVVGLITLMILKSPDLGSTIIILTTSLFMLFVGGSSVWSLGAVSVVGIRVTTWLIWRTPYQKDRFLAFLNPWADPLGKGFHLVQSLIAIGSGGFWGVGLGQSTQKFSYLPQQFTDFIYSIICEELGLVGGIAILVIFILLVSRGFRIAYLTNDRFVQLLAAGISFLLLLQAILNIMVATSMVPPTGLTLPFISYGGSSLVSSLVMVGVLANLSRRI